MARVVKVFKVYFDGRGLARYGVSRARPVRFPVSTSSERLGQAEGNIESFKDFRQKSR
jgi:hypothetical protein